MPGGRGETGVLSTGVLSTWACSGYTIMSQRSPIVTNKEIKKNPVAMGTGQHGHGDGGQGEGEGRDQAAAQSWG